MTLNLYYTSSDAMEMNKKLTIQHTVTDVHPVDGIDVENPTIRLGNFVYDELKNCNYAYIPEYKRYYYVEPPTIGNNHNYYLQLHEDYLMSFAGSIKALPCIIDRVEDSSLANLNYNDGSFVNQEGCFLEVDVFNNGFSETPYNVLIVAGL